MIKICISELSHIDQKPLRRIRTEYIPFLQVFKPVHIRKVGLSLPLSLVLENENLTFIKKVRLMTVVPSSLLSNYILLQIRGTTDYMIRVSQKLVKSKGL